MINAELARLFERIANLLEIDGADRFRVNSYRRASRSVKNATEDVADLVAENRVTDLPGVGKGTADKIKQLIETGRIDVLDELEAKLPQGLPDLLDIPGMGPKKVAQVYHDLQVECLVDLKAVIADGRLAELPGLGAASVKKIAEGITFLESSGGRTAMGEALPVAERLMSRIESIEGVRRAEIAGSLRRGEETIGDVDILCETGDGERVIAAFTSLDGVRRVLASGGTKGSVTVALDDKRELQVDLRAVQREAFGAAWQYFTGSKEHNVRLRELALRKGWRLNEYGLYQGERRIAGDTEESIYEKLGLTWIPPELREDRGEFESETEAQDLVTVADIRGDLHMHTIASDGKNTIAQMVEAAKQRGYKYIAICDHSKSSTVANGLSILRMTEHIDAIRAANEGIAGLEILAGCECDILPDGSMDYPDDLLAQCDFVVGSIHSAMGSGGSKKLSPTERTLAAMENRYVSLIGHPTGRLINRRPPMEIDISTVVVAAARTKTMLEINSSWKRLDLKDTHARQAMDAGVTLSINTDAHHTDGLSAIRYGVTTARRAGATKGDILNCCTLAALLKKVAAKRA